LNPQIKRQGKKPRALTDLSDFWGVYPKTKCFIVGAGPSVGLLDLSNIHAHVVIAVNSAAILMPWHIGSNERRFWISNDVLCARWNYFDSRVVKAQCVKIVRKSWQKLPSKDIQNFRFFQPRKSESHPLLTDDPGLCHRSSIPTALDFALRMGCTSIYLLGVDQQMVQNKSHFWQWWPPNRWPRRADKKKGFQPEKRHQIQLFNRNIVVFEALHKFAQRMDVKVYNCSNISSLKVFPLLSLEQAFNQ
jgi:hypothetical protein